MYLRKIILKNIKCFANFDLDFAAGKKDVRMWTALLGQNGLGKSTLLQAIGVALAGPAAVRELLPVAEGWVRRGESYGEIEAELLWTEGDALTPHWPKKKSPYVARYIVTGDEPERLPEVLRVYEGCARALSGNVRNATLIKMHRLKSQMSYLKLFQTI